ncbi:MAG: hypothetical protein FJ137_21625 [Deltaproteobacteria bacterium]|nr:hypothetical protein [Deltaproteobacteria bacterium]
MVESKSQPLAPSASSALPPLQTFYRELSTLPAKQRLDRILSRQDTMRVVRQMPVPDLYATIREIGVEDCLEVLELMSPAQVQGFLDLDGWRRDRIDPTAVGRWLGAFFAANSDRAAGQLRGLDLELLTLLFKVHCTVYDLAAEEQPEHDVGRHTVTPDQRYLIVYGGVSVDEATQAVLQQAVDRLMGRDMLFVLRLCEAVRWELASQLEEDALRWRNGRLADLGFLPAHEAAAIFAYVDPDKSLPPATLPAIPPPPASEDATSTDLTTSVLLPWASLSGEGVLARALGGIDEVAVRDRVAHELMLVANRVHAADGADLGDSDALKETARQVAHTVGTGLAYAVRGDEAKLVATLSSTSVMLLFRVGYSLSLKLGGELRARVRVNGSGLDGRGLLRLDAPLREVVAGLLRPRPLLYAGLVDDQRVDYRPVASLGELAAAAAAVTEAAFRAALLARLGAHDGAFVDVDDAALPGQAAVLAALLAQAAVGSARPQARPLSDVELDGLRSLLRRDGASSTVSAASSVKRPSKRTRAGDERQDDLFGAAPPSSTTASIASAGGDAEARALAWLDAAVRPLAPLPGASGGDDVVARARAFARPVWAALTTEVGGLDDGRPTGALLASVWAR